MGGGTLLAGACRECSYWLVTHSLWEGVQRCLSTTNASWKVLLKAPLVSVN